MAEPNRGVWQVGAAYEPYVGRWSRVVAREFLAWLGVPPGRRWLDLGCGTGALTEVILRDADPATVEGLDPSEGYLAVAGERVTDQRVTFRLGEASTLPFPPANFDVAVAGLVLNFLPDRPRALAELCRVVRPGGLVAGYVWDYAEKMQLMRYFWDAAVELDPAAVDLDQGRRFAICQPAPLAALFTEAGLNSVDVRPIDIPTRFKDFDDYWMPFLGGQFPAPAYVMSLSDHRRSELRDRLRQKLPIAADGTIELVARAWAVRGYTPGGS